MSTGQFSVLIAAVFAMAGGGSCRAIEGLDGPFDLGSGGAPSCPCGNPLPDGWLGPAAVYEGPPGTVPSCPEEYPTPVLQGGREVTAAPATCAACTCDAPAVACTPGAIEAHTQSSCNGSKASVTPAVAVCTPFSPSGSYLDQSAPDVTVGPCAVHGGTATVPPAVWKAEAIACGRPPASPACACGLAPPPPFEARTCIYRPGAFDCPPGFPTSRGWVSLTDTRGCAPCTCGPPLPAVTCTVTAGLFGDGQCTQPLASLPPAGSCVSQAGVHAVLVTTELSAPPSCMPAGGSATGTASGKKAVTVCCAP